MKVAFLVTSLIAITMVGCRTNAVESVTMDVSNSDSKPTYVCFERETEQKLIEVQSTDVVAHTRPDGKEIFEIAMKIGNRELQGVGLVTDEHIDVSASDAILGQIQLKARPQDDELRFNVLQMFDDIKFVKCLRLHEEPVGPEPAASGSNQ